MLSRITVPLLLGAAVLVFACGPRKPTTVTALTAASMTGTTSAKPKSESSLSRLAGRAVGKGGKGGKGVVAQVSIDTSGGDVRFVLDVANDSPKRVELDFPDGRTHDFVVLDGVGREVWRWSTGRMFTSGMQNRLLDANAAVQYAERWAPAAAGRYTLVAELRSANYPVQQRVEFSLPGTFASR